VSRCRRNQRRVSPNDKVSIVVRRSIRWRIGITSTLEDCLIYDWILPNRQPRLRQFFNKVLKSRGFDLPERFVEVDSMIVGRSLLCSSDRVAILSYFQVEQEVRWGRLSTLRLSLPEAGRRIGILTKEDYLPTPFVSAYIEASEQSPVDCSRI